MVSARANGKVIRVSPEVFEVLARKKLSFRSWDALLRCVLGLRPRRGDLPRLKEIYLVEGSRKYFERLAEARGEAVKVQAREGGERPATTIRMREVL